MHEITLLPIIAKFFGYNNGDVRASVVMESAAAVFQASLTLSEYYQYNSSIYSGFRELYENVQAHKTRQFFFISIAES